MIKILQKIFQGYITLEEIESPINGRIQIHEDVFGKKRLVIGGLIQSGETVEKIWEEAIKQFSNFAIKHCLILGLGAGSVVKILSRFFPGIKILGIEIDPLVLELGKKYFCLSQVKNLKIKKGDATLCVNELIHFNERFDLILVDLYLGEEVPAKAAGSDFIKNIKTILSPSGTAIFNRLYNGGKIEETDSFEKKLGKIFPKNEAIIVKKNKLFLCQNKATKRYN